jgi:hypothetical protein
MRTRLAAGAALVLCSAVLALPAEATLSEALSMRELVDRAGHVVLATAVHAQARRDARNRIVTDFTLRVEETMKGGAAPGSTLVMTRLGGAIGDIGMRVEGEPHLELGARYVLFLSRASDGRTLRPVGMSQGVLPVREEGGRQVVEPGGGGLSLVQRVQGGRLVTAPPALLHPERYEQLRDRVQALVLEEERGTVRP